MKKCAFLLLTAFAVLATCCNQKPKDFVLLGQHYNTYGYPSQEKIYGRVKELKQSTVWALEENGKVVKGKPVTMEDRKTTPLTYDLAMQFDANGANIMFKSFDENGKVLTDIKATGEGKIFLRSDYYTNDTLAGYGKYKYDGNNLVEISGYNPLNDTLLMSARLTLDKGGMDIKSQTFNYKGEPGAYTEYKHDENGNLVKVQSYLKDGKPSTQYDYTYNTKGERIAHHQQNFATGQVIDYTFTYEYDKSGNYITMIYYKDKKPFLYRTREITYYE